jgi:integrase
MRGWQSNIAEERGPQAPSAIMGRGQSQRPGEATRLRGTPAGGMRPSEAVALRVKSVDLAGGTLFVERSRSLGAEAAPKTAAAARVVRLRQRVTATSASP